MERVDLRGSVLRICVMSMALALAIPILAIPPVSEVGSRKRAWALHMERESLHRWKTYAGTWCRMEGVSLASPSWDERLRTRRPWGQREVEYWRCPEGMVVAPAEYAPWGWVEPPGTPKTASELVATSHL